MAEGHTGGWLLNTCHSIFMIYCDTNMETRHFLGAESDMQGMSHLCNSAQFTFLTQCKCILHINQKEVIISVYFQKVLKPTSPIYICPIPSIFQNQDQILCFPQSISIWPPYASCLADQFLYTRPRSGWGCEERRLAISQKQQQSCLKSFPLILLLPSVPHNHLVMSLSQVNDS